MPVNTDTFRNMKWMNVWFMLSAIALVVATFLLVFADWNLDWRAYQVATNRWDAAMTEDAVRLARQSDHVRTANELEVQLQALRDALPHAQIAELEAKLADRVRDRDRNALKLANEKGKINPKQQQIERARLAHGEDSQEVRDLEREMAQINQTYTSMADQMAFIERDINDLNSQINAKRAEIEEIQRQITNLTREFDANQERLGQLRPTGAAKLTETIRNAPLLDWMNPSLKPQQDVVPEIRTDYNFLTV